MNRTDWEDKTDVQRRQYALDMTPDDRNPDKRCYGREDQPPCSEPAGTPWTPMWCADHDAQRLLRLRHQLAEIKAGFDA